VSKFLLAAARPSCFGYFLFIAEGRVGFWGSIELAACEEPGVGGLVEDFAQGREEQPAGIPDVRQHCVDDNVLLRP
jgi:hypothetical protein